MERVTIKVNMGITEPHKSFAQFFFVRSYFYCYNCELFVFKVKTTPHVSGSVNPVWDSVVEFPVRDFTKVIFRYGNIMQAVRSSK